MLIDGAGRICKNAIDTRLFLMSNPADQLHDLFSQWREKLQAGNQSVTYARGDDLIESTMYGFRLVDQLESAVDRLEELGLETELHRRNIVAWRQQLLALNPGWSSAVGSDKAHPVESMNSLKVLGQLLSIATRQEQQTPPNYDTTKVAEFVAEVREVLDADQDLPSVFREYIEALVDAVESAMEHRDSDQLVEELQHLWVSVFAAAEASEGDTRWRDLTLKYGGGFAVQTIAGIVSGVVTHAITGV